jgi:hypothetical protein
MLAAIGSIIMILTTVIPLIWTAVRVFPKIRTLLQFLFMASRGTMKAKSGLVGILLFVFTFFGGFSFLVSLYFGFGFELYLKIFDIIFTPFSYVVENLIRSFISQLPSLPANSASVLCLFDFSRCFTLLILGFSFEVYMRILIYFLVRRGK